MNQYSASTARRAIGIFPYRRQIDDFTQLNHRFPLTSDLSHWHVLVVAPLQRVAKNAVQTVDVFKKGVGQQLMVEVKDARIFSMFWVSSAPFLSLKQQALSYERWLCPQVLASDPNAS